MSQLRPDKPSQLSVIPNPFARDVVGSPLDDARADIPRINAGAKRECASLIESVDSQRESASLLIFGDPGSGKTHLLSRLRQHIDSENEQHRLHLLIPLRMQTSPGMMWRFIRRNLAQSLFRRLSNGKTLLQAIYQDRRAQIEASHWRDLRLVLLHLLERSPSGDASAWLLGDDLPETALAALGLSTHPADEEFHEERAHELVRELARLAEPTPFVFCLDQVEALQRHQQDQEGIFALGKVVATLHDTLHNAAIVCCVQTAFIDQIKAVIRGAEQDRMLTNRVALNPLTWDEASDMLIARLAQQPEIESLRPPGASPLWPIDPARLKDLFQPGGACLARKVLHRAKELYNQAAQKPEQRKESVDAFLHRIYAERQHIPPPQEADAILRDGLPRLFQALGMQPSGADSRSHTGTFDLMVEHDGRVAAFALCNQAAGVGLVNRFRKLGDHRGPNSPRLVLLRDARLGIGPAARASHQKLEELRKRRAEFVNVTPEALAALDTLRGLLTDADAGDLSLHGESISRQTVEQWLVRNLPDSVSDLLEGLKGEHTGSSLLLNLTSLLGERKILSMEEASRILRVDIREIIDCASQNPQQLGLAGGRRAVLFQPVASVHPG